MAKKIGNKLKVNRTVAGPEEHVVVFGTQRIGAIYALRAGIDPRRVRLATEGMEGVHFSNASITVVRVPTDIWTPPTLPCERRTKETEQALKRFAKEGCTINDVYLH